MCWVTTEKCAVFILLLFFMALVDPASPLWSALLCACHDSPPILIPAPPSFYCYYCLHDSMLFPDGLLAPCSWHCPTLLSSSLDVWSSSGDIRVSPIPIGEAPFCLPHALGSNRVTAGCPWLLRANLPSPRSLRDPSLARV